MPPQDGSKAVLKGNPTSDSRNAVMKPDRGHKGVSKKIVWDHAGLPSTNDNVLQLLHDFVNQFLSGSYNGMSICQVFSKLLSLLSLLDDKT